MSKAHLAAEKLRNLLFDLCGVSAAYDEIKTIVDLIIDQAVLEARNERKGTANPDRWRT